MLPISQVMLTRHNAQENKWILYDIYKIAPGHKLEISYFGWINTANTNDKHQTQYETTEEHFETFTRKDLKGLKLLCGSTVKKNYWFNKHQ